MRIAVPILTVVLIAVGASAETSPDDNTRDEQYFSEEGARVRVFGDRVSWHDTVLIIDSAMAAELKDATGLTEMNDTVRLHYGIDAGGAWLGAYRIASEIGKYHPFEFLVGLDSTLRVKEVVVLNYRESRGGEVQRARFTRQYRGKSVKSPVRLNRDVLGISGATLSSMAVNRGVKKTLWWADSVWPARGESR